LGIAYGVSAGIASLVLQISPFISILMGAVIFSELITIRQMVGIVFSLCGLGIVFSIKTGEVSLSGIVFVVIAAFSWSICNVLLKVYKPKKMINFVVWSSLFSPLPIFTFVILVDGYKSVVDLDIGYLGAFSIVFQAYITTLWGYTIWNSLIKEYPLSQVAPLSLLVPVFGMFGSILFFQEQITFSKVMACLAIIAGLICILIPKNFIRRGVN
jgi:O-acetylserine/cysteine efflux transporter